MNKRVILTVMIMFAATLSKGHAEQGNTTGMTADRLDHITHFARQYVDQGQLPGVVYAVARRGQLARLAMVGNITSDAMFRIYSMTKPITVVATLILYEQGRFLLSDPLSRFLPEFETMQVYVRPGETRLATNPITIEQLLTHTAGLSYDEQGAGGVADLYAKADIWSADSLAAFTQRLAQLPLAYEPGTRWHYSVANDVLGRLVEVVSGQGFDEFMAERILTPLKMTDTAFVVPDEKLERFLPLYRRDGDTMTLSESAEDSAYRNPNLVPYGGHGLVSTATDYLRFLQMLLNHGELEGSRILGRKTVELMMMDHLGNDYGKPPLADAWLSLTENRTGDLDLGMGFGYGGYVIRDVAKNAVPGSVGTYAWGGGASTYFFIDPQEELIGLFLTQLSPSTAYPLRAQFRGLVYQAIVD